MTTCPFCNPSKLRVLHESMDSVAFWDNYPSSDGHVLVVPRKHVSGICDLPGWQYDDLWRVACTARSFIAEAYGVKAFTIGVNDGVEAGQTVDHAHIHIIPRRAGDVEDPRGGIRWVLPGTARYWS